MGHLGSAVCKRGVACWARIGCLEVHAWAVWRQGRVKCQASACKMQARVKCQASACKMEVQCMGPGAASA